MMISAHTANFGVVGSPVAHSLSPFIHNSWIKEFSLDAVYSAYHLETETAASDLETLHRFGVSGLNVTLPYKKAAIEAAVEISDRSRKIGAANTLVSRENGWFADNTDAEGFLLAIQSVLGKTSLEGCSVLMIGAGGAARAAVYALNEAGARLTIVNRTIDRAEKMAEELAPNAMISYLDGLSDRMETADIVVNATSLGHSDETPFSCPLGKDRLFYDLSYGKAGRMTLDIAQKAGWRTEDGLRMLIEQARIAFELWHGVDPDISAVYEKCRTLVS